MAFFHPFTDSLINALSILKREGIISSYSLEKCEDHDLVKAIYNVNIPQYPVYDIRSQEVVIFTAKDNYPLPFPYFEREDFPSLPHLLRNTGGIKSPCLYQAFPEQIALEWNALEYAYRIFTWLLKTSEGVLHEEGQPLEDFVMTSGGQLLLSSYLTEGFYIKTIDERTKTFLLDNTSSGNENEYYVLYHDLGEKTHTGIHPSPVTLLDIKQLTAPYEERLVEKWILSLKDKPNIYRKRLFIILTITISDKKINKSEKREYAFIIPETFYEVGLKLGVLGKISDKGDAFPLICTDITKSSLQKIPVLSVSVHHPFNKEYARFTNGLKKATSPDVVQIGLGAIGSQIARNCTQAGFAESWVCIDNDSLLPHNLARWVLEGKNLGMPKARIVSDALNTMFGNQEFSKSVVEKIPFGSLPEVISNTISSTSVLIDTSASISVQRTLDYCLKKAIGRFTVFLNPNGKSLAIFFTPLNCEILHSQLEMTYYHELAFNDILKDVLLETENTFTYGGDSCRALSAILSTHNVSQFSAIASGIIEQWSNLKKPSIGLWRTDKDYSISYNKISTTDWIPYNNLPDCKILVSSKVIEIIKSERRKALPNETGGILIGAYDVISETIYILHALSAPKDSDSKPFTFHRGMYGTKEKLNDIESRTHSNLYYIGEWHSHPDGFSTQMSELDLNQINWLRKESSTKSFPYMMLICNETKFNIYI